MTHADRMAWYNRAGELADWALAHVFLRTDRFGGYYKHEQTGKASPINRPSKGPKAGALTRDIVIDHFCGTYQPDGIIGAHSLRPEDSTGRVLVIDIDNHDDQPADPIANEKYAKHLYDRIAGFGFRVLLVTSNGAGGFHLWVILNELTPGAVLRAFGLWAVRDYALHGLAAEPEVFPKQDFIKPEGFGNWPRLPGRHHTKDHWSRAWDGDQWLDAAGTVALVLTLDGDDPKLIPLESLAADDAGTEPTAESKSDRFTMKVEVAPGDDFCRRGTWAETGLFDAGGAVWHRRRDDGAGTVTRPGKDGGVSGTVGLVRAKESGFELFVCFSTNWSPFAAKSYNRFAVFAMLKCGGDFGVAAGKLRGMGYGSADADNAPAGGKSGRSAGLMELDGTDVANGRRIVADHGASLRFVADMGQWFVFDGVRWAIDRAETRVEHLAKQSACAMAAEAAVEVGAAAKEVAEAGEDKEAQAVAQKKLAAARQKLADAKKFQDMRSIGRALRAARSRPEVCVLVGRDVFDVRPDLLNCPNGTVELRTGKLREHRRDDFLTKLCPTRFNPSAPRSQYLAFLNKVFHGRPRVAAYVREFSGYVATGETNDHAAHISHGVGANGKSVQTGVWGRTLGEGEYAHVAPPELLVRDERGGRHPTEKTGLRGARLVVCSETDEDAALDEKKVKELASSDVINARYMRGDFFSFRPTHKLILCTNHRPRVRGQDHGIWRRLRLIPYGVRFWKDAEREADPKGDADGKYPPAFKADPGIEDRLVAEEAEGVLADMVEHAVRFYANGRTLNPPPEVVAATAEYRKAENVIAQFFDARVRADETGR